VPALERRYLAPLRLLGEAGLVAGAVFALMLAGTAAEGRGTGGTVAGLVLALVGVALLVPAARQAARSRALITHLGDWGEVERRHRDLPAGDLAPELRTPFDARHAPDFEQVAGDAGTQAYVRAWRGLLLLRSAVAGLGLAVGLALLLGVLLSGDMPAAVRAGFGAAGVVALGGSGLLAGGATRLGWRWSRQSSAVTADVRALRAGRLGPAEAARVSQGESRRRAVVLGPLALVVLVVGVVRVSTLSDPGRLVGGLVVLGVLLLVGALALLRRFRRPSAR
jgi:hypothetical protein